MQNPLNSLFKKIKYWYWAYFPLEFRPGQLKWKLIHRFWDKPWRITPKYLSKYNYYDKTTLLPHYIFQILCEFYEEECGPDSHIDWRHEEARKVNVDGEEKLVIDEIKDLYDWWNNEYIPYYNHIPQDIIWAKIPKAESKFEPNTYGGQKFYKYKLDFKSPEDKQKYDAGMAALHILDEKFEREIILMMNRVCNIIHYLWT